MGEGALGSNSGGVKPTGASTFFSSAAAAMTRRGAAGVCNLRPQRDEAESLLGSKERTVLLELEAEMAGVKREAWVAMAMKCFGDAAAAGRVWNMSWGGGGEGEGSRGLRGSTSIQSS
ncbi:unnamed protein product [Victoria cruziana]